MERMQFDSAELSVLLRELKKVLDNCVLGDVVELGCYKGDTAIKIGKQLRGSDKILYAYDSFAGLPDKTPEDLSPAGVQFREGELPASKKEVLRKVKTADLHNIKITKAWFYELKPEDLPEKICFAFLDGDFYQSIHDSLKLIWKKLEKNSVIIVDDYSNEALPGAAKAVDEWLISHPARLRVEQSLAIISIQ